jgi:hypothetical protein
MVVYTKAGLSYRPFDRAGPGAPPRLDARANHPRLIREPKHHFERQPTPFSRKMMRSQGTSSGRAERLLKVRMLPKADAPDAGEGRSGGQSIEALDRNARMIGRIRQQPAMAGLRRFFTVDNAQRHRSPTAGKKPSACVHGAGRLNPPSFRLWRLRSLRAPQAAFRSRPPPCPARRR